MGTRRPGAVSAHGPRWQDSGSGSLPGAKAGRRGWGGGSPRPTITTENKSSSRRGWERTRTVGALEKEGRPLNERISAAPGPPRRGEGRGTKAALPGVSLVRDAANTLPAKGTPALAAEKVYT